MEKRWEWEKMSPDWTRQFSLIDFNYSKKNATDRVRDKESRKLGTNKIVIALNWNQIWFNFSTVFFFVQKSFAAYFQEVQRWIEKKHKMRNSPKSK